MFDSFDVKKVLIIAPLRVAKVTWAAEIQKWEHLKNIRYSVAVGTEQERINALKADTDIYIINRENVQWLIEKSGIAFDFDTVVIDELSSFKNHQAKRFRALMKVRPRIKRIIGLTGTPTSNGLMDLYSEFKLLDMGKRLGRFIGQYRNTCYENFANAIIEQAVRDYIWAENMLKKTYNYMEAESVKKEVLKFFYSGWFTALTDLDPDILLKKIHKEVL